MQIFHDGNLVYIDPDFYVIEHVDESGTHYYLESVGEHSERWAKAPAIILNEHTFDNVLKFETITEAQRYLNAHKLYEGPVRIVPIMPNGGEG